MTMMMKMTVRNMKMRLEKKIKHLLIKREGEVLSHINQP